MDGRGSVWVPGTPLLFTTAVALLPVPVWLVATSTSPDVGLPAHVVEVIAVFALGNLSALLAERMVSRGGALVPSAAARWTVLASLSLAFVSLLLVVTPFVSDALRALGVDDLRRWQGLPALMRYWKAVVVVMLAVTALAWDGPEMEEDRVARRSSRAGRRRSGGSGPRAARPVEARPAAIRARHPVNLAPRV